MRVRGVRRHGESGGATPRTPEYRAWRGMMQRCYLPTLSNYDRYGGRGIRVCERWREPGRGFENFVADVGRRPSSAHSLDRINTHGDYEPGNVRWATPEQQQGNRTISRVVTFRGETLHLCEWARRLGVPHGRLVGRLKGGWDIERALTEPERAAFRPTTADGVLVHEAAARHGGLKKLAAVIGVDASTLSAARRGRKQLSAATRAAVIAAKEEV